MPMATVIFALCASDIALRAVKENLIYPCHCEEQRELRRGNLAERNAPYGLIPTLALGMTSKNDIALRAAILLPMATVLFALCASDIALRAVKEKINLPCDCYVRK